MHRFLLFAGVGLSILASDGCAGGPSLPLAVAAARNAADIVRMLLLERHDPNQRDAAGLTPLMWAARAGAGEAIRALLDGGADPNRPARMLTPLMMAAADADPVFVEVLLAHGADPTPRGSGGATALTVAVSGGALSDIDRPLFGGCHAATVKALLTRHPTLALPDSVAAREALWWARFHGCAEVLSLVGDRRVRVNASATRGS